MPNWCSTTIEVSGRDATAFNTFVEKAKANASVKTDFGNGWLGHLLIQAGFDKESVIYGKAWNCRGYIVYSEKKENGFVYDCESAWSPCVDVFEAVRDKLDFDIDFEFFASEPGCEVFVASSYEFARGQYYLDGYAEGESGLEKILYDESECVTAKELEARLRDYFNDDESSLEHLIEKANNIDFEDDEWLNIYEIELR